MLVWPLLRGLMEYSVFFAKSWNQITTTTKERRKVFESLAKCNNSASGVLWYGVSKRLLVVVLINLYFENCYCRTVSLPNSRGWIVAFDSLLFQYNKNYSFFVFLALWAALSVMICRFLNRNACLTGRFVLSEAILCDTCKIKESVALEGWNL